MNKENYGLLVTILRIIAGVFGVIAFVLMFLNQAKIYNYYFSFNDIAFGADNYNAAPIAFIGYILIALGAVASIALIFVKGMLGNAKTVKMVDFIVGAVMILGALLVVLTTVWMLIANSSNKPLVDNLKLEPAPIVACVFAALGGGLNVLDGFVEEKI